MYALEYELELGKPWANLDTWRRVSQPFLHADRIVTPTLFLCGQEDWNVPLLNSEQMYQALKSLGRETELVIYPGRVPRDPAALASCWTGWSGILRGTASTSAARPRRRAPGAAREARRMRSRSAEVVQILGLVGLLLGCGSHSKESDAESQPAEHNAELALEVENHGWSDIVIYLVRGTSVERLGMVGGLKTETFVFPYRKLGVGTDVRLRAYPIGGPRSVHQREPAGAAGAVDQVDAGERSDEVVPGGVLGDGLSPLNVAKGATLQPGPLHFVQGDDERRSTRSGPGTPRSSGCCCSSLRHRQVDVGPVGPALEVYAAGEDRARRSGRTGGSAGACRPGGGRWRTSRRPAR